METRNNKSGILIFGLFSISPGSPVKGARVYLETEPGKKLIAFQQTGESGSITFAHLDKDVYKIYMEIPRQKGNLEDKEISAAANFQVGWHSKKKVLLFQNPQGNFRVKFSDLEKLDETSITPMHETESSETIARIAICKLNVTKNFGKATLKLSALSASRFQKQIKKYEHDAGMAIISAK